MLKVTEDHSEVTKAHDLSMDLCWYTHRAQEITHLFLLVLDEVEARLQKDDQTENLEYLRNNIRPEVEEKSKVPVTSLIKAYQSEINSHTITQHRCEITKTINEIMSLIKNAIGQLADNDQEALCRSRVRWRIIDQVTDRSDTKSYAKLEAAYRQTIEETEKKCRKGPLKKLKWHVRDHQDQLDHDKRRKSKTKKIKPKPPTMRVRSKLNEVEERPQSLSSDFNNQSATFEGESEEKSGSSSSWIEISPTPARPQG